MKMKLGVLLIFAFALCEIFGLSLAKNKYFEQKTQETAENLYGIIVNQSAEIRSGNPEKVLASSDALKNEIAKFKKYSGQDELVSKLEKYQSFIGSNKMNELVAINQQIKSLNEQLSDNDFKTQYESLNNLASTIKLESNPELEKSLQTSISKLAETMKRAGKCKNRCSAEEYAKIQTEYDGKKDEVLALVGRMNDNIQQDIQTNLLIEELKKVEKR